MEEDEYKKLSIEDRCVHKLWKARVHGYEEVTKLFRQIDDDKSTEFGKYLGLVKKFVTDGNAVGQEKGLEATLAFVENYAHAGKTVGEVMSGIVNKCMFAPKAKTRELALQITLTYIEIEKHEAVQEELMKGMDQKNPKIVSACIVAITTGLREFGSKVISVKPLIKKIPTLLSGRDKGVRDEGKIMVVEIYKWIGVALKSQLTSLQPVQIAELETEFAKVDGQKVSPTRYLRSQQEKRAKIIQECEDGDANEEDDDDDGEPAQQIDAYDLADPVDVLSKMPKDFFEKVEAKKWQERKEAVEAVENLLKTPKLESGEYGDLVRALKKIISKDSNVVVIAVAGKCLASLASGLKKRFQPYAGQCIPALLEKFKDKKQAVIMSLREAIDAIYLTTNIEPIVEDVLEALGNKNPAVKLETASFLSRSFSKTQPSALNKKLLKSYTGALIKTLNEPDPGVRDASAEALGTLMKLVGDKAIAPFLVELEKDGLKLTKIKECCEKAVIQVKIVGAKKERPNTAPSKSPQGKAGSAKAKPVQRPNTGGAPPVKKKPIMSGTATITKSKPTAVKKPIKTTERDLSNEEVDELAGEIFSADVVAGLADANWKVRLSSMEKLTDKISDTEIGDLPVQVYVKIISRKPGLKDTNFQVLKTRLDAVKILAEKSLQTGKFSTVTADCILNDVTDKLGDTKNGTAAADLLSSVADATSLEYVSNEVLNYSLVQKSPKVQQEALLWIANAVREFGITAVNSKGLIEHCKKSIAAINPAVRTSAVSLLGTLYLYMGPSLHSYFDGEKPALKQQIAAEFEKYENERPPLPIRGMVNSASREDMEESEDYEDALSDPLNAVEKQDNLSRVDIGGQITEAMINDLSDKNWKVRNEALTKLSSILSDAKLIKSNIGDLPQVLAQRLCDSNSKIAQTALAICQTIAESMGPPCKQYVRAFFPGFLQGLGDSKNYIRAASITCINTWGDQAGYKEFFEGEMIADAFKNGSPTLRAELWLWLSEKLDKVQPKTISKEELMVCLPHLYTNLEDRNPEVRKNANEAVLGLMIHLGFETMAKNAEKLKPSSKPTVMGALDKARPYLPVKALPKEKARVEDKTIKVVKPNSAKVGAKVKAGAAVAKPSNRKKEDDVDLSPLLVVNNLKHQRVIDEQKLRVLKWNFTTPREEFVELLKDQMTAANVNRTLISNMFHADFRYHLKAIESLSEDITENSAALISNLDLVLKWLTLRFFDTNPSVLLKGLEYLHIVFNVLEECKHRLLENEASSFVPYLVMKIGDPKDAVRNGVRSLFKQIGSIYPMHRIFSYVMEGIKSKNARQRTECLEVMGSMIEYNGIGVCVPSPAAIMKEVARQISDRDNSVRNAALNCIVQAHFAVGDQIYKMVGQISDKDMSLLEERIKRVKKNAPRASSVPSGDTNRHSQSPGGFPRANNVSPVSAAPQPPQTDDDLAAMGRMDDDDDDEMEDDIPQPIISPPQPKLFEQVQGPFKLDTHFVRHQTGDDALNMNLKTFDLDFLNTEVSIPSAQVDVGARVLPLSPPAPASIHEPFSRSPQQINSHTYKKSLPRVGQELLIEKTINNIGNPNFAIAIPAIENMQDILQSSKANLMTEFEDQFMIAITVQLKLLHSLDLSASHDVLKVYRALLTVMDAFYSGKIVGRRVSSGALKDILNRYIMLLVESKLEKCENGTTYVRIINLQCVKMIEKSDHTNILCALIRLLHECVLARAPDRLVELVMKCLWRAIKMIPSWKDEIEYESVLLEVHIFFKDFPSHWWKNKNDTPMKTMKTVVHSMTKCKGSALVMHMGKISNAHESELEAYLMKILKSLKLEEVKSVPVKKETRQSLSRTTHQMLTEIFQKIGSKEETREGLTLLYDFKQQHPEADIEPFLKKSSPFFQDYIENGLKDIAQGRLSSAKEDALNTSQQVSTILNMKSTTTDISSSLEPWVLRHNENFDKLRTTCSHVEHDNNIHNANIPADWISYYQNRLIHWNQKSNDYDEQ